MYGARAYSAYLGYRAKQLFQDEILRGNGNFWLRKKEFTGPVLSLILHGPLGYLNFTYSRQARKKGPGFWRLITECLILNVVTL